MEYAYWPGKKHAEQIIVVGEHELDDRTKKYLDYLQNEFNMPIDYQKVDI